MDSSPIGLVLGRSSEASEPLQFWFLVADGAFVQLDDIVHVDCTLGDGRTMTVYGIVDQMRHIQEPTSFAHDVEWIRDTKMVARGALLVHVAVTRVEPEIFVPPQPGTEVYHAHGDAREMALFFEKMKRVPFGSSRDGEPVFANMEFLDGTRGAHVNISGISGVATKTSYAMFLLHSLFEGGALGLEAANTRSIIFNVKGEDLLFLDRPNNGLNDEQRGKYAALGLPAQAFGSVALYAPVRKTAQLIPDTGSRLDGVTGFCWTLREFCAERYLRFLFTDADDERSQIGYVAQAVEAQLAMAARISLPMDSGTVEIGAHRCTTFDELVEAIAEMTDPDLGGTWGGRAAGGTVQAFLRRLEASAPHVGALIRGDDSEDMAAHRIDWQREQVTVVDIHRLHDRAKRFVVGTVLKRMFEDKEARGAARPLVFVVLDELNKYAPREGRSPIKEVLLDIAERGRSLGVILIGAQQTASEVEPRVVANCSFRVVGRLDTAEAQRAEYGFLTPAARARASLLKPGTMILHQPEIPVPLLVQFPFPAWATRASEAVEAGDPFTAFD